MVLLRSAMLLVRAGLLRPSTTATTTFASAATLAVSRVRCLIGPCRTVAGTRVVREVRRPLLARVALAFARRRGLERGQRQRLDPLSQQLLDVAEILGLIR